MSKSKLPDNEKPPQEEVDVAAELANVGKKLRDAVKAAWQSEERHKIQGDVKAGLEKIASELNEAAKSMRESSVGQKVESGVQQVAGDIKSGKVADEARKGLITALRSISESLDKMANSFTPAEGEEEVPKE